MGILLKRDIVIFCKFFLKYGSGLGFYHGENQSILSVNETRALLNEEK